MPKTEEQIRTEGTQAINEVISAHLIANAPKLRREIRRAFPFGPAADTRTKEIWNELVDNAVKTLKGVTVIALVLLFIPAHAADRKVSDGKVWYSVAEEHLTPTEFGKKIPFSIKHPKLHRAGRAVRKKCQSFKPIADLAADIWVFFKG